MVRISKVQPDFPPVHQYQQSDPRRRHFSFRFGCLSFFILCIVLLVIFCTALIAKTGIIEIPYFSKMFYAPPRASREVNIGVAGLGDSIASLVQHTKIEKDEITIELSDKDLTLLIRQIFSASKIPATQVQLISHNQNLELFGFFTRPLAFFLQTDIKPGVHANTLNFQITRMKIGNLSLPPFIFNYIQKSYFHSLFLGIQQKMLDAMQLTSVEVYEGKLILKGKVKEP